MKKALFAISIITMVALSCEKEELCEKCLAKMKSCGFISYDFRKEAIDRCVAYKRNMEFLRFCEKAFRCEDIAKKIVEIGTQEE